MDTNKFILDYDFKHDLWTCSYKIDIKGHGTLLYASDCNVQKAYQEVFNDLLAVKTGFDLSSEVNNTPKLSNYLKILISEIVCRTTYRDDNLKQLLGDDYECI